MVHNTTIRRTNSVLVFNSLKMTHFGGTKYESFLGRKIRCCISKEVVLRSKGYSELSWYFH